MGYCLMVKIPKSDDKGMSGLIEKSDFFNRIDDALA